MREEIKKKREEKRNNFAESKIGFILKREEFYLVGEGIAPPENER